MNKLLTKIAGVALGLTMAVGVGVAVGTGSSKKAVSVQAAISSTEESGLVLLTSSNFDTSAEYVLKSTDGYYWNGVSGTSSSKWGGITKTIADVARVTLNGTWADGFTIKDSSNNYLRATTGNMTWATTNAGTFKQGTDSASNAIVVNGTANGLKVNGTSGMRLYTNVTYNASTGKSVALYKIPASITVTYNANGGSGTMEAGTGTSVTVASCTFTAPSGKVFDHWNTESNDSGTTYAVGATITSTTTLYAIWEDAPTDPYLNLEETSYSKYTGQEWDVGFTYGNIDNADVGDITFTSSNSSVADASDGIDAADGTGSITFEALAAGDTTVTVAYGGSTLATFTVSVTASSVTISGLSSTGSVSVGGTLNLGSQITVTAVGSYSDSVTWSSATTSVATVSSSGVVTGVGLGTSVITVTSVSDPSVSASCTVTVALIHVYTWGTSWNSTQLNDIDTTYGYDPACFSGETTLYGTSASGIRMAGSSGGSTKGSFVYDLPDNGAYITKVTLTVKAWSSSENSAFSVTPDGGSAVTFTYTDYSNLTDHDFSIPASGEYTKVTVATTSGRAYVSAMSVEYAYKDPEITTDANNFEIATSGSQKIDLTFANYATTPTVTYSVTSGASSVSSVTGYNSLTDNVAAVTITATSTTATGVTIRFTGTAGSQTAYIDIVFDVITPKTITDLEITTDGTTSFVEDESFSVGPLVLTATFSDSSTTIYSAANDNLGLLTFDPVIGTILTTSDTSVTVYVTAYGDDVFQMYDITVSEKPYAAKVTSVDSLWDGQEVYFADQSATRVSAPHAGGNNMGTVIGTFSESKGLSINDTTGAQAYTVGRVSIDSVTYYTFSFVSGETRYWLSDTGTSSNNYMGRISLATEDVTTLNDTAGNCGYWTISITDGVASITSKTNTAKPSLRWNSGSSIFACYSSSGNQTDPVLYAVNAYSTDAVATSFKSGAMHMDDYSSSQGYCKDTDHNYYANAKRVWNAMSSSERGAVDSATLERLSAWASANGDVLSGTNVLSARVSPILNVIGASNNTVAIIVVVSLVSLTAVGGYFFLKKKKEQ